MFKSRLCKTPVLSSPDIAKPLAIHCDDSQSAVRAVLVPVSRRMRAADSIHFKETQRNYTSRNKYYDKIASFFFKLVCA